MVGRQEGVVGVRETSHPPVPHMPTANATVHMGYWGRADSFPWQRKRGFIDSLLCFAHKGGEGWGGGSVSLRLMEGGRTTTSSAHSLTNP